MPTILISYRREDSRGVVGRIYDRLEKQYGKQNIFFDIDAIPPGTDFRQHLRQILEQCDLVIAVIGPRWAGVDESGKARILDETDWVRIEIEAALTKNVPIIPVLIDRTSMPAPQMLPPSIRELAFRQAAEVDAGRDFHTHMDRLIKSLDTRISELALNLRVRPVVPASDRTNFGLPRSLNLTWIDNLFTRAKNPPTRDSTAPSSLPDKTIPISEHLRTSPDRPDSTIYQGIIDGNVYKVFLDGSAQAELPQGTVKFASVDELQKYLLGNR